MEPLSRLAEVTGEADGRHWGGRWLRVNQLTLVTSGESGGVLSHLQSNPY